MSELSGRFAQYVVERVHAAVNTVSTPLCWWTKTYSTVARCRRSLLGAREQRPPRARAMGQLQ